MIDSYELGGAFARAVDELEEQDDPGATLVFMAAPHKWGEGKVHILEESVVTLCGQDLLRCPGEIAVGHMDSVTCLRCVRSFESSRKREQQEREWAERNKQWTAQRGHEERMWRERYDQYLHSEEWRERRALVLERDGGVCQGCLRQNATQVHHLSYRNLGDEMLFDLVSLCVDCHSKIHGRPL